MGMIKQPDSVEVSGTTDPLAALLSESYFDAEAGQRIDVATRALVISKSLAGNEAEIVAGLGFGRRLAVISDPATFGVLGHRVEKALAGRFEITSIVLPVRPEPDGPGTGPPAPGHVADEQGRVLQFAFSDRQRLSP